MFCPSCGHPVSEGSTFCPGCGRRISHVQEPAPTAAPNPFGPASRLLDSLDRAMGGSGHVDVRLSNFFDAVFRRHARGEADMLFACGSPATTPPLANVSRFWPHPWLYSRVFLVLLVATLGLIVLVRFAMNPIGVPGLMFVSSLMAPFTIVVFFFETNVPRNLGIARVIEIFFVGGVFSILCIYPISALLPGGGTGELGASLVTGITEEVAKGVLIVFFVLRLGGRNYILTGLLVGAAVGAGFDAFETAGYVLEAFLGANQTNLLNDIIQSGLSAREVAAGIAQAGAVHYPADMDALFLEVVGRMPTGFCTHVAWAAVTGGAVALASGGEKFEPSHLASPTFVGIFLVPVAIHGLWDAYIPVLSDYGVLGMTLDHWVFAAAIWVVLVLLLHRGVVQMNQLSAAAQKSAFAAQNGAPGTDGRGANLE